MVFLKYFFLKFSLKKQSANDKSNMQITQHAMSKSYLIALYILIGFITTTYEGLNGIPLKSLISKILTQKMLISKI